MKMQQRVAETDFDIVIVGGGMVGASLACALGQTSLKVAVIESVAFNTAYQPSFDARTVALAYGSRQIFHSLGLWQAIASLGVTPIEHIHVSDRGHAGLTHMDHESEGIEALGYVVETRILGRVLHEHLAQQENITLYCPARLSNLVVGPARAEVEFELEGQEQRETISAKLVVAADGGDSAVRELVGIETFKLDYGQYAVIANVATDKAHNNTAYERFTASGPMALLPIRDEAGNENTYALVWTVNGKDRDTVLALEDEVFLEQLQQRFNERAGRFIKVGERHVYPLGWMQSREHVRQRVAIIGNAAHTLHPVAGQGFNLGLRDVAALAQVVVDGVNQGEDPGAPEILQRYARWRKRDQWQTGLMTDGIVRIFSTSFAPVALLRNIGLTLFDIAPPLKHKLARHAMGFAGKLPRLVRGLRL